MQITPKFWYSCAIHLSFWPKTCEFSANSNFWQSQSDPEPISSDWRGVYCITSIPCIRRLITTPIILPINQPVIYTTSHIRRETLPAPVPTRARPPAEHTKGKPPPLPAVQNEAVKQESCATPATMLRSDKESPRFSRRKCANSAT